MATGLETRIPPRARAAVLLVVVAVLGMLAGITVDRLFAGDEPAAPGAAYAERDAAAAPPDVAGDRFPADAYADDADETAEARPRRGVRPGMRGGPPGTWGDPAARALRGTGYSRQLVAELELTPEQQVEVDRIVAAQQAEIRRIMQEFEPRFRGVVGETRARIDEVLTPEQRLRLTELQRARMREQRGGPPRQPPLP
jgi:hypothetical protein